MEEYPERRSQRACPECGEGTSIKETVPWQPNICAVCGSDVPDSAE